MESGVGQYEKLIVHYQKTEKLPMNQRNRVFKQKKRSEKQKANLPQFAPRASSQPWWNSAVKGLGKDLCCIDCNLGFALTGV